MIRIDRSLLEKMLAAGLLLAAAAALAALLIAPLAGSVRSALDERRLLLKEAAKLQGLVEATPQLQSVIAQVDAHPLWQRVYGAMTPSAAEAELQKDFRSLADGKSISLDTLQPLDPVAERDLTTVRLRVGFNTSIDHLGQLLAAMQAAPRFMKFENLYVTSPMTQTGSGNPSLVVRGDVLAYALPESAP